MYIHFIGTVNYFMLVFQNNYRSYLLLCFTCHYVENLVVILLLLLLLLIWNHCGFFLSKTLNFQRLLLASAQCIVFCLICLPPASAHELWVIIKYTNTTRDVCLSYPFPSVCHRLSIEKRNNAASRINAERIIIGLYRTGGFFRNSRNWQYIAVSTYKNNDHDDANFCSREHILQMGSRRKIYMMTISFASQNSVYFGSFQPVWLFFNYDAFGTCASKNVSHYRCQVYRARSDWAHATRVFLLLCRCFCPVYI